MDRLFNKFNEIGIQVVTMYKIIFKTLLWTHEFEHTVRFQAIAICTTVEAHILYD